MLVKGNDIKISFHQNSGPLFPNVFLCLIKSVQMVTFMKQGTVGRIHVLRRIIQQGSAPESDHAAGLGLNGKHDPTPETIVDAPSLATGQKAQFQCLFHIRFGFDKIFLKRIPLISCISD